MEETRPDLLETLRAAATECGVSLPEGLLEEVLRLEKETTEQDGARGMIQVRLRTVLERHAEEAP